jgi:ABC-type multidrug transport system fused ATPase/permease subunit
MKSQKAKKCKGGTMWSTGVPFDTQFHGDLPTKKIDDHVRDMKTAVVRLQEDIQKEIADNKIKLSRNNERQTKIEEVNLRNAAKYSEISTKWYMFLFTGLFSLLKYLLSALGALLHVLMQVLSQLLLLVFAAIKIIMSNPVIVGAILLVISIILILQFVFGYLVPLPGFVSKKPPENKIEGQAVAESKVEYEYDFVRSMKEFFLSIPQWFDNALVNMKLLYQKLAKFFGNKNVMDMYIKDREEDNNGRWDNIINMELGALVQGFENVTAGDQQYIYSIIKPKDLDLKLSELKSDANVNLDLKKLPEDLYKDLEQDKDILKFKWDLQNVNDSEAVQYIMSCNSYDKNNKVFKLYTTNPDNQKECMPIKVPFKSEKIAEATLKYYDINVVRGDKSLVKDEYMQIKV